jgi:subtilisin family serine protease
MGDLMSMKKMVYVLIGFIGTVMIVSISYLYYFFNSSPIITGVYESSEKNIITIQIINDSIIPINIYYLQIKDEKLNHINNGKTYQIILKGHGWVSDRQELEEEYKHLIVDSKPFDRFTVENKKGYLYGIYVEETGDFSQVSEIIIKFKILGVLPFSQTKLFPIRQDNYQSQGGKPITDRISWGIMKLQSKYPDIKKYTGKGVRIAIVDSGVDVYHQALNIKNSISLINSDKDVDKLGHGTQMAGIINARHSKDSFVGIAPDADIISIKIIDTKNQGKLEHLEEAILWCLENEIDIVNISMAAPEGTEKLESIIQQANKRGIYIVVATANWGETEIGYPANYPQVFSVAAINIENKLFKRASYNETVDFLAPGEEILTTLPNNEYAYVSGSSHAAAFVSGLIALIIEKNGKLESQQMTDIMNNYLRIFTPNSIKR